MRHTREQLERDAAQAAGWAAAARSAGREADAGTLERLADAAGCAAARFGTRAGFVDEDPSSAETLVKNAAFFAGAVACPDLSETAEACPYSKDLGICRGCGWTAVQWIYAGRRYECLTAHACRFSGHAPNPRQEREKQGVRSEGIIYRPQDIP